MRKKLALLLISVMLMLALAIPVLADMGPKPSVSITFTGLEGRSYFGTLLSKTESTGPASVYNSSTDNARYTEEDENYAAWRRMLDFEDTDGYYFLQNVWKCEGNEGFRWGYYPPADFKVLLWFPDTDTFAVSEARSRYAFDTYYEIDATDLSAPMVPERAYDYTPEILSLTARIVLTVMLEAALALLFGYTAKKQLLTVLFVNLATQTALNMLLNITDYFSGSLMFRIYYLPLEVAVFVVEALVYAALIPRYAADKTKRSTALRAVLYALTANAMSYGAGLLLAHVIPGIF